MNVQETIDALIVTLSAIEVHGRQNLDKLLGCIITCERLREQLKQPEPPEETGAEK